VHCKFFLQVQALFFETNNFNLINFFQEKIDELIRKQVNQMRPIALRCTRLVHQTMKEMIKSCLDGDHDFPEANSAITKIAEKILDEMARNSTIIVENYIDVQTTALYTSDKDFFNKFSTSMGTINPVKLGMLPMRMFTDEKDEASLLSDGTNVDYPEEEEVTARQKELCGKVRELIKEYFDITRSRVADHVPKALLHSLIYAATNKKRVESELVRQFVILQFHAIGKL